MGEGHPSQSLGTGESVQFTTRKHKPQTFKSSSLNIASQGFGQSRSDAVAEGLGFW